MGWQDNIVYDNGSSNVPPPQAWQNAIVYDSNSQQPIGQTNSNSNGSAPNQTASNGNIGNNQQMTPPQEMYNYFSDKPDTIYSNILPFSTNAKTGENNWDYPEAIRSPARGLAELLSSAGGEPPAQTEDSGSLGSLSKDALGALTMISPTTAATDVANIPRQFASGVGKTFDAAGEALPQLVSDEYEGMATKANPNTSSITTYLSLYFITIENSASLFILYKR